MLNDVTYMSGTKKNFYINRKKLQRSEIYIYIPLSYRFLYKFIKEIYVNCAWHFLRKSGIEPGCCCWGFVPLPSMRAIIKEIHVVFMQIYPIINVGLMTQYFFHMRICHVIYVNKDNIVNKHNTFIAFYQLVSNKTNQFIPFNSISSNSFLFYNSTSVLVCLPNVLVQSIYIYI